MAASLDNYEDPDEVLLSQQQKTNAKLDVLTENVVKTNAKLASIDGKLDRVIGKLDQVIELLGALLAK